MISVVLAAGHLPHEFSEIIHSTSPFRLPLGTRVSIELVLERELSFSKTCLVVVRRASEIPGWLKEKTRNSNTFWIEIEPHGTKSIGGSLLTGLTESPVSLLNEELRVIFADTLSGLAGSDLVAVGSPNYAEDWTFAPESLETETVDPRARVVDPRVVIGAFAFSSGGLFMSCLQKHVGLESDTVDPLWKALKDYSQTLTGHVTYFEDGSWVDFGHVDSYKAFRKKSLAGRSSNSLSEQGVFIRKTSTNSGKLEKEANWFGKVPSELFDFLPRVALDEDEGYRIQFLEGFTLAEWCLFLDPTESLWDWALGKLEGWFDASENFRCPPGTEDFEVGWFEAHFMDRIVELRKWESENSFGSFTNNAIDEGSLQKKIKWMAQVLEREPWVVIHGDLIPSNIIVNPGKKSLKLIDPRGGFSSGSIFGPQLYDWAKLAQGIFGRYEELVSGHFTLSRDGCHHSVEFWQDVSRAVNYQKLENWFELRCPEPEIAKQLSGILLLAATPFHFEDAKRVVAMTQVGLELMGLK